MKKIFFLVFKLLTFAKYLLLPMALSGQSPQTTTHCAKKDYVSYWDKKGGPSIDGKKATYHYFEIPFHKIISSGKKTYKILHPDYLNECKEDTLIFKDGAGIIPLAEGGDRYNIAMAMMYLDGVPTGKWFVCPSYPPPHP